MKSGDSLRRYNDTGGHCCSAEASCDNTDTSTNTTSLQQPPHSGHGAEASWLLAQGEARRQGSLVAVWRILALLSCVPSLLEAGARSCRRDEVWRAAEAEPRPALLA